MRRGRYRADASDEDVVIGLGHGGGQQESREEVGKGDSQEDEEEENADTESSEDQEVKKRIRAVRKVRKGKSKPRAKGGAKKPPVDGGGPAEGGAARDVDASEGGGEKVLRRCKDMSINEQLAQAGLGIKVRYASHL